MTTQYPREGGEFLTFKLGGKEYGIDVLRVQEIRSYEQPTQIADAKPHIKGVLRLRGVIAPIVDLRIKLGCQALYNDFTVVIVVNTMGRIIGVVVDSVSDVVEINRDRIMPAPEFGNAIDSNFVIGTSWVSVGEGKFSTEHTLTLIDIEGLLSSADMGLIAQT
jgi:purine-binding chemotaxis protein CheW